MTLASTMYSERATALNRSGATIYAAAVVDTKDKDGGHFQINKNASETSMGPTEVIPRS